MENIKKRKVSEILSEISWESITPPYLNYHYFQDSESQPFQYEAREFDVVNAWWLIEASILANAEEHFIREKIRSAGLPEMRFFSGLSTQCYVANNDNFVIVVFRGTEINRREGSFDFRNILADLSVDLGIPLVNSGKNGKVHEGFKNAIDEVWEKEGLLRYIRSKDNGIRTVWFTGHSLGAALATLAADRYSHANGLYTFGSPRVGDEDFKNSFNIDAYRIVNNNDIVTELPPAGFYCHVGNLKYIDRSGVLHNDPENCENLREGIQEEIPKASNYSDFKRVGVGLFVPDSVIDHVPLIYSVHLWNNIFE